MTIKFEGPPENESECDKLEKEYLELERAINEYYDETLSLDNKMIERQLEICKLMDKLQCEWSDI